MQRELPCRINGFSVQKRRNPPLVVINCVHFATKWSLDHLLHLLQPNWNAILCVKYKTNK